MLGKCKGDHNEVIDESNHVSNEMDESNGGDNTENGRLCLREVKSYFNKDQKDFLIKLPDGVVQPWYLLWNRYITNHCKMGKGWYQSSRNEQVKEGGVLTFWKLEGENFLKLVLRRTRE
ncbi:DNA-binding barrel domain superfamily [Sesbania bispinosa]|nr:DNA-binding barrel domain superfamily [Sesbania bispinosa]